MKYSTNENYFSNIVKVDDDIHNSLNEQFINNNYFFLIKQDQIYASQKTFLIPSIQTIRNIFIMIFAKFDKF